MSDGGPAFPWCGDLNDCPTINLGMTLRDYFAAKAMQAYVSSDKWREDMDSIRTASMAYRMADAMLKERDK
jgi:hypothetical protein